MVSCSEIGIDFYPCFSYFLKRFSLLVVGYQFFQPVSAIIFSGHKTSAKNKGRDPSKEDGKPDFPFRQGRSWTDSYGVDLATAIKKSLFLL
jgi:hypothetical protein